MYKFDEVDLEDPIVWNGFKRGDTVGIFQLEAELGKYWSKRLKPSSIEELSDLVSLLRPGPLKSQNTELYAKRKSGDEPLEYLHSSLEPILNKTQGIICYQEQCSKIVMELGDFTPSESQTFQKGISKKLPEVINKCKVDFISRAEKKGIVTKEKAEEIFAGMQTFQRYGFAKAHGIEYSLNSYFSMYAKIKYPMQFYCSWLTFAKEKIDPSEERALLIQDARLHGIKVLPPDIRIKNVDFKIIGKNEISFGISHIRGIGNAAIKLVESNKIQIDSLNNLIKSVKHIKRGIAESLTKAGALDHLGLSRSEILRNIHVIFGRGSTDTDEVIPEVRPLTLNEFNHFKKNLDSMGVSGAIQSIIDEEICVKKRIPILESKIEYLKNSPKDSNQLKATWEKIYLGKNLTCSSSDDFRGLVDDRKTCKQVILDPNVKNYNLCVVIDKIDVKICSEKSKTPGELFAFLSVSDNTATLSCPLWAENYAKYKDLIWDGCVLNINVTKRIYNGRENININKLEVLG